LRVAHPRSYMTKEKWVIRGKPMEATAKTAIAAFRNGTSPDWTKKRTSIPGVFIVYMPYRKGTTEGRPLGIEFNPTDSQGNATKRRGIYLGSKDLKQLQEAAKNPKLAELVDHIEAENPEVPAGNTGDSVVL